jgi:cytoskeletal protein CcmA (bactofilin family)
LKGYLRAAIKKREDKMYSPQNRTIKFVLSAIVLISLVIVPLQAAMAQAPVVGNNVPSGQVVEDSLVLYGPQVSIDGVVNGDVLAIGQDVTLNGEVKGSLVTIGSKVLINGKVGGNIYSASGSIEMGPTSDVHWSLYSVGGFLTLDQGSQVERDLYTMSLGARLMGSIGRNTRAFIGLSEILRLLLVDTGLMQSIQNRFQSAPAPAPTAAPTPAVNSIPGGQMVEFASLAPLSILKVQMNPSMTTGIGSVGRNIHHTIAAASIDTASLGNWLYARFHDFLPLFIIGLILAWLFPRFLKGSAKNLRTSPLADIGLGLLAYIVGYGATILLLVLILGIGVFFVAIKFWGLAWLTWGVGLSSLGLAFWIFSLAVGYLSKIVVSFFVGDLILSRLTDSIWRRFGAVLVGLIIFVLLVAIPILGWVITFLTILFGLGAIVSYFIEKRRMPLQPEEPEVTPPASQPAQDEAAPATSQLEEPGDGDALQPPQSLEATAETANQGSVEEGLAAYPPENHEETHVLPETPEQPVEPSQPENFQETPPSTEPGTSEESPPSE